MIPKNIQLSAKFLLGFLFVATLPQSRAANTFLMNFSTNSVTVLSGYTTGTTPSQSATTLILDSSTTDVKAGDGFTLAFGTDPDAPTSFNWSSYPGFALLMSLTGVEPGLAFGIGLVKTDISGGILAAYFEGETTGLTSTPSLVTLNYVETFGGDNSVPINDLSDVSYLTFKWIGGDAPINATFHELQAVPEPSTGSLILLGAAGVLALRRLRKV